MHHSLSMSYRSVAFACLASIGLSACSGHSSGAPAGSAQASYTPDRVEFVVDTGPGGGSDLFARQIVKLARQNKLISGNWPVMSQPQGGGLGAMSFLKQQQSSGEYISAFTSKWVVSGLQAPGNTATLADLTPIAELIDEQQMIAAPAKSPYKTFADFVADAKNKPGQLVQVGGSYSSVDNLIALKIEQDTGTHWKYLSFAGGGPRITALLRGDAQIMIGSQNDFAEEVAAGQLKIIGVIGDHRASRFPDVPTLAEQGFKSVPAQLMFRGIAGPPDMPPQAVKYYQSVLQKLVKTDDWKQYMKHEGATTRFITGDALHQQITQFTAAMKPLVQLLEQERQ